MTIFNSLLRVQSTVQSSPESRYCRDPVPSVFGANEGICKLTAWNIHKTNNRQTYPEGVINHRSSLTVIQTFIFSNIT